MNCKVVERIKSLVKNSTQYSRYAVLVHRLTAKCKRILSVYNDSEVLGIKLV